MSVYPAVDAATFWEDGYRIVRRVFSPEEIASLRTAVSEQYQEDEARGWTCLTGHTHIVQGDVLSKPRLRHVVLDDRVLAVARGILGQRPVYFGDSSYQVCE